MYNKIIDFIGGYVHVMYTVCLPTLQDGPM